MNPFHTDSALAAFQKFRREKVAHETAARANANGREKECAAYVRMIEARTQFENALAEEIKQELGS